MDLLGVVSDPTRCPIISGIPKNYDETMRMRDYNQSILFPENMKWTQENVIEEMRKKLGDVKEIDAEEIMNLYNSLKNLSEELNFNNCQTRVFFLKLQTKERDQIQRLLPPSSIPEIYKEYISPSIKSSLHDCRLKGTLNAREQNSHKIMKRILKDCGFGTDSRPILWDYSKLT